MDIQVPITFAKEYKDIFIKPSRNIKKSAKKKNK